MVRATLRAVGLVVIASACGHTRQAPPLLQGATPQPSAQEQNENNPTLPVAYSTASRSNRSVTLGEAMDLAQKWFEAARVRDANAIIGVMALPSAFRGFTLTTGPEANACGATPDTNGLGLMGIEHEMRDSSELAEGVRCLFLDGFFLNSIPVLRNSNWPPHPVFPATGGSIALIGINDMADRLTRWRAQCEELAKTHFLVQARMTDGNGITNHVVLTIDDDYPPRVDGVFIDELFEE